MDVQSARTQQTISKDILTAIPSSRNAGGIQALVPGMSTEHRLRQHLGDATGGASTIHGGRTGDSRIYADGNNMGWSGGGGGGGNMPQVASSQEVVMTTSGGLGEAETAGVIINVIPREGANTFNGQFNFSGSNGAIAGQQLYAGAERCGAAGAFQLDQRVRRQPDGRRPDHPGQALVLRHLPPDRGGADGPGHVEKQERGQPECLDGRFRQDPSRRLPIRCNARRPSG